jgi:hypothetical protein
MYLMIFMVGAALICRRGYYFNWALVCILAVAIVGFVNEIVQSERERVVCYAVKKHSFVLVQSGDASLVIGDTLIGPESDIWQRELRNDVLTKGNMPEFALFSALDAPEGGNGWLYRYPWLLVGNRVILVVDPTSVHQLPISAPEADILYILGEPYLNLPDLHQRFPNAMVVIGGNAGWKRHAYYLRTCRELGIPVHSVRIAGALTL